MKTILTILTVCCVSMNVLLAGDLERKALEYAHFTGRSYEACLHFLELGAWCRNHPQGGAFGGQTYDAKMCAETLSRVTSALQTPATAEDARRIKVERQIMAERYAELTGRSPEECMKARELVEWCAANKDGGVWDGKKCDPAEVAALLTQAREMLTPKEKAETSRSVTAGTPPEQAPNADEMRQMQMAQKYAVATGQSYELCLKAVVTYEWCMAHPNGSVVDGVTYDAAATTRILADAMKILNLPAAAPAPLAAAPAAGRVIESRIDGDFEGFEGDKVFKLVNGQVWQQMDFTFHYHYAYGPRVMIYQGNGGTMMKVDGVDRAVRVMQLR